MSYPYGNRLKLYIDGASHDERMTMTLSGVPAGIPIDETEMYAFLSRRAPGGKSYTTQRTESDVPHFLSGLRDGVTDGGEIVAVIRNEDRRPDDYPDLADTPRPSHADYAAVRKYGSAVDLRGGGHFSGRLTAMLCVAGGIALQILSRNGIHVFAHAAAIGGVYDEPFPMTSVGETEENILRARDFPTLSKSAAAGMLSAIEQAKADRDSVGGIVECAVTGVPAGYGEHMFRSVEGAIASAVFAIPAVKGVSFGSGFSGTALRGSENNDPMFTDGKSVFIENNRAGGILGGMTSGAPIVFSVAVKPTPSIGKPQNTVSLRRMENTVLTLGGRHDPCIVPRAVPVVEAAAALAIWDLLLENDDFVK